MHGCRFSDWVGNLTEVRICMDIQKGLMWLYGHVQKGLIWLYGHTERAHMVV